MPIQAYTSHEASLSKPYRSLIETLQKLYRNPVKVPTQLHKRVLDEGVLAALSLLSFIEAYRCLIADLTKLDKRVGRVAALSLPPPVLNPM